MKSELTPETFRNRYLIRSINNRDKKAGNSSPFHDKSFTYTFSDWLVPYALGVGADAEDLDEIHLGGFPDLSYFLERDEKDFRVNFKILEQLFQNNLTGFGKKLREWVKDKMFFDLGCGELHRSVIPRIFASKFSASYYIGVDSEHIEDQMLQNEFSVWGPSTSLFFKEDILSFLTRLERPGPSIYFLSGIELVDQKQSEPSDYILRMLAELDRLVEIDDLIILGAGCPDLDLDPKKYRCLYSDVHHGVFQKKRGFLTGFWPFS